MERVRTLRNVIGVIKDKAALSRATLLSNPNTLSLRLAVLRATTHDPTPPHQKHFAALLSLGHGSRSTAAALVEALMDRLQGTRSACVALKCLVAAHYIVKRGGFILQDQLSVFPAAGGRNYLKLSAFRDGSNPTTWRLSAWVRWYARYLELLISASRVLGFFLRRSCGADEEKKEETLSAMANEDLVREIDSLVGVLEEIHKMPESLDVDDNELLHEVGVLVDEDFQCAADEVWLRVREFLERLSCLSFGESVELACALKRLEDCKERLSALFPGKKDFMGSFWGLISEAKEGVGKGKAGAGERMMVAAENRREKGSESARFGAGVLRSGDSVGFSSARFGFPEPNNRPFTIRKEAEYSVG